MFGHDRDSLFLSERTNGTIVSSCIQAYPKAAQQGPRVVVGRMAERRMAERRISDRAGARPGSGRCR